MSVPEKNDAVIAGGLLMCVLNRSCFKLPIMAKKLIKRFMPDAHKVRHHKHLKFFGKLLHDPNLWHLNRHSTSGAMAIGLFVAFIPLPLHIFAAAALAILLRVNLPIALVVVWINNPFTIAPIFYFAYKLGALLLGVTPHAVIFDLSWDWFATTLGDIWQPLVLGSLLLSTVSAAAGYYAVLGLWRLYVISQWGKRKARSPRAGKKR